MLPSVPNVKAIFDRAVEIDSPVERQAFLTAECGNNDEVRRKVEALLQAYSDAGSFLDSPPVAGTPASALTGTYGPNGSVTADLPGRDETIGTLIAGKYKLIEAIGEGGMGSVFMAQQTAPVKRAVAVKVIKAGMDSKAVLARFEAERQALAMMDHPNIARVLDAGTTESGRPFFVMELVKGVPITKFCDERRLTLRERLALFVPVCQAIQHAHQKGIIHRDIKPSNVLVAMYDDQPVPKVIDFGVAKAAGQPLTDRTLMTGFGAIVGTPEYMSPEQASFNQIDVDTRTDVYALGVLLYELLTGSTPIDHDSLGKAAILEVLRIVREVEPPTPSQRLSKTDALPTIAANRKIEPIKLTRLLRGDLDWIVMKALEKDRTRRYETASALTADVRRFLSEEPVEARPPSAWYRIGKLARRNKVALTTAALLGIVLVLATAVSSWQAVRAINAERAALNAEDEAKKERDRARDALMTMFELGTSFQRASQDEQALAVFLKAHEASQRAEWPEGTSLISIGASDFLNRGKFREAEQLFERLVQLSEEWHKPEQAVAYRQKMELARLIGRTAAAMRSSTNNLKQIGLAMHNYNDTYGALPPAAICDKSGRPLLSWRVAILPFLGEGKLFNEFKLDEPWDSEHNRKLVAKMPKNFLNPRVTPSTPGMTNYRVCHGKHAALDLQKSCSIAGIPDGTSNTMLVFEAADSIAWTNPTDFAYGKMVPLPKFWGEANGFLVLMADGMVRFFPQSAPEQTMRYVIEADDLQLFEFP